MRYVCYTVWSGVEEEMAMVGGELVDMKRRRIYLEAVTYLFTWYRSS